MPRFALKVEYQGAPFAGWQRQKDVLSVQQAIEEALYKFCQQDIRIHAAGRTDAGVHALAQIAHFDLDYGDRPLTGFDFAKALNAHLRPHAISVLKAEEVHSDFHARFDAANKLYKYRIIVRPSFLALEKGLAWQFKKPLDAKAMQDAAQVLIGHHDFTTFRDSHCQAKSADRTLQRLDVIERPYDDFA